MKILKQETTICERYCLEALEPYYVNDETIVKCGDLFEVNSETYLEYLNAPESDRYSYQTCKDYQVHRIKVRPVKVISTITRYTVSEDEDNK